MFGLVSATSTALTDPGSGSVFMGGYRALHNDWTSLCAQSCPALSASGGQDCSSTSGCLACAKAMCSGAFDLAWLEGSFHDNNTLIPLMKCKTRKRTHNCKSLSFQGQDVPQTKPNARRSGRATIFFRLLIKRTFLPLNPRVLFA